MSLDCALILNPVLTKMGGSRIDDPAGWANFSEPRVVNFLLEYGREFPTTGLERIQETPFPDWHRPLDPVHCHRNCVDLRCYVGAGASQYRVVHGWALSDNDTWYCHSWCIKRTGLESIVETTLPRIAYFGFVVPDEVNPLGTLFVPSTLGEELENWKSGRQPPQSSSFS
jgi:hypothetical protein